MEKKGERVGDRHIHVCVGIPHSPPFLIHVCIIPYSIERWDISPMDIIVFLKSTMLQLLNPAPPTGQVSSPHQLWRVYQPVGTPSTGTR